MDETIETIAVDSIDEVTAALQFFWASLTDSLLYSSRFWEYFILFTGLQIIFSLFFHYSGLFDRNISYNKIRNKPAWAAVAGNHALSFIHGAVTTIRAFSLYNNLAQHSITHGCTYLATPSEADIAAMNSAYFVVDMFYILIYTPRLTFILHHIVCVWGAISLLQLRHCGPLWVHLAAFGELTTPILKVSWFARAYCQINPQSITADVISDSSLVFFVIVFIYARGFEMTRTVIPAISHSWAVEYTPFNYIYAQWIPSIIAIPFVLLGYVWVIFGIFRHLIPQYKKYALGVPNQQKPNKNLNNKSPKKD